MGEMLELNCSLIEPVYSQTEPNQPIALGKHAVEVTSEGDAQLRKYECDVRLQFLPKERLVFEVLHRTEVSDDPQTVLSSFARMIERWERDPDEKLSLVNRCVDFDVFNVGTNEHGEPTYGPKSSVVKATALSDNIKWGVAHLFNFPEFLPSTDYRLAQGAGWRRCGRIVLSDGSWRITIAATDRTSEACNLLKQRGGFAITHMVKFERLDNSVFSCRSFEDVLRCLHHFLAFALGRWAGLALPIGFDEAGNRVFEEWGLPMAADGNWNAGLSWFDSHSGETLAEVFPGFMKLWKDELWNRAVQECLYWYVAANERGIGVGIDTGLILTQTALEQLAWTYCVKYRKMVSPRAFGHGGLYAADKLRLLLSSLDIPLAIPDALSALVKPPPHTKNVKDGKWDDALHALTEIRNSIVHPDAKFKPPKDAIIDSWKLSLWLIEMSLLRLCTHNGRYGNRLRKRWAGETELVPWAALQ